jgi:hypothetical protein
VTDVQEMVAGRELDALVAERVMGWCLHKAFGPRGWRQWEDTERNVMAAGVKEAGAGFCPSTDIAAAWQVLVEALSQVGTANIRLDMEDYGRGFFNDSGPEKAVWVTVGDVTIFGPAPLAICRAALQAIGASEP